MGFDFSRLLTLEYFLDKNPGGDFLTGYGLLIFFILLLFGKSILQKFAPDNKYFKKSIRKKLGKFIFLGVGGIVLVAARFSAVPFFSMRLFLYGVFLMTIFFLIRTFLQIRGEYIQRIDSVQREKKKRGEVSGNF